MLKEKPQGSRWEVSETQACGDDLILAKMVYELKSRVNKLQIIPLSSVGKYALLC